MSDSDEKQYVKMTETPIPRLVVRLGIPTTLSMLVTTVYNLADNYFVGQLKNASASGAIGVVFGLMAIIQAFGFMFGHGSGSIIARSLGKKDKEKATRFASTGFFFCFLAGTLIGVLGLVFLTPLMRLLGSTETILPFARQYSMYILIAAPFLASSCVLNNILRYEGKANLAMIGLMSGGLLNILLDWLLIIKMGLGVSGAGIATAISQTIGFCILLTMFLLGKTESKVSFRKISRNYTDLWLICTTGFPSMLRQGLSSISTMVLNRLAGAYGDCAVTAMTIVNRVSFFAFAVALGIGQGFQPISAFNYGAKKYSRVKRAFLVTLMLGECFLVVLAAVGMILSKNLIAVFQSDPDVIKIGTTALRYSIAALVVQPIAIFSNMLFQSIGKNRIASLLAGLRSGLAFIPALLLLSTFMGLKGIQIAQPIADLVTALIAAPFAYSFLSRLPDDDV